MGQLQYLDFKNLELRGQKVFLRLDLNVPLKDGKILDTTRVDSALPTLNYLLEQGAKVIVASHLGRPKTDDDRQRFSLEPVAQYLNSKNFEVFLVDSPESDAPMEIIKQLKDNRIILLENLRFSKGEIENSSVLAQKWSRYCDLYVNDAFGACHRAHASIDAMARLFPIRCFGYLIEKEIAALDQIKNTPQEPFTVVTGGSKVSDKIDLLASLGHRAQNICIGGAMAYTFLKAQGVPVGNSLVEKEKISLAKDFLDRMKSKGTRVVLPVDHAYVVEFPGGEPFVSSGAGLEKEQMGVDIGPQTMALFEDVIVNSSCVFWNGPMGVYERPPFDKGSLAIATAMGKCSGFTVVGGGDSAAIAMASGENGNLSHISTGGGASMEYIQGAPLPGLEVLKVRTIV